MSVLVPIAVALFVAHMLATFLGASSITFAEWQYFHAIVDGRIEAGERAHLVTLFFSLRFALIMVLLVNILLGFVLAAAGSSFVPGLTTAYWFEMGIILVLITTSWLRFHGRIPFWAGSSIAFVGWWYLAGMDLGFVPVTDFAAAALGFAVSVIVLAALFGYVRFLVRSSSLRA
ncbi:MAG: hypothetical protein B7X04_01915 [Parcubacteria group bacterium 21-54-25]|nr:MAG: hypothetical protein B7X04_01915 [Parcubacteria group bacterium 21-54-25]HQU07671.1 hypothetical protein [Candidatus Paceibacterota bacterium]